LRKNLEGVDRDRVDGGSSGEEEFEGGRVGGDGGEVETEVLDLGGVEEVVTPGRSQGLTRM